MNKDFDKYIYKETGEVVRYSATIPSFYCQDDKIVLIKTKEGETQYLPLEEFMENFEHKEEDEISPEIIESMNASAQIAMKDQVDIDDLFDSLDVD